MNIWDIKNRWFRAAVAWVLAIVATIVMIVVAPFVLIYYAGFGVMYGVKYEIGSAQEWSLPQLWAAMTAKDQP